MHNFVEFVTDLSPVFPVASALIILLAGIQILLGAAKRCSFVDSERLYRFSVFGVMLIMGAASFLLPISPANDSFDMINALGYLLDGRGFVGYHQPYYSFWANNKIALIVYFGACYVFKSVELGVRIANFVFAFGTAFFVSLTIGRIFGERERLFGLFASTALFPFIILMGGPYTYPISIFAASLTFFLGVSQAKAAKPFFFVTIGLLYLLRPTASIFILVYFAFNVLKQLVAGEKRQAAHSVMTLAVIAISMFAVKAGVGAAFYYAGLHPYPNLTSAASGWTFDIGTRLDGENTGKCTYSPISPPDNDQIATMQHQLWNYCEKSDPSDYQAVKLLSKNIKNAVFQRTMQMFKADPENLPSFLKYKLLNLFDSYGYRFYFYALNYNNPSLAWEAYHNFNEDSETHINALAILFAISSIYLIISAICVRKYDNETSFNLSSITSCIATLLVLVVIAEVGQRSLLDALVPLMFAACSAIILATRRFSVSKMAIHKMTMIGVFSIFVASISLFAVFSTNNISCLKDADFTVVQTDEKAIIELTLVENPPDGYYILYDQNQIPLSRNLVIETEKRQNLYLKTPTRTFEIYATSPWK